ncbi:MAG: hypothetical protein GEV06_03460 [Luteitalea sp.]|nr:hypothetical protein [Luteitalea sp.]
MNFVALRMLTGDRAKYFGLVFAIAFCTFLLENQTSIFAGIMKRTGNQVLDVTDAEVWVMDPKTEYLVHRPWDTCAGTRSARRRSSSCGSSRSSCRSDR